MVASFERSLACPAHSVPPTLQQVSREDFWTLTDNSGSFSCGVSAPFAWVLLHKLLFVLFKSLFLQSCVCAAGSMVGLMLPSSKRADATPGLLHQEPLPLQQSTAHPDPHRRLKHSSGSVSLGPLGPGEHMDYLSPTSISGRYGVSF